MTHAGWGLTFLPCTRITDRSVHRHHPIIRIGRRRGSEGVAIAMLSLLVAIVFLLFTPVLFIENPDKNLYAPDALRASHPSWSDYRLGPCGTLTLKKW